MSSTFEDFKLERDALQLGAFKNLRTYCQERGWQFQAVDLRWGISNEATIDQRTMEICLKEIERCQELSPKPNFVVLLGQRYGWQPLPDRIIESIMEEMKVAMTDELKDIVKHRYELDENQLPEPVWCLKSLKGKYLNDIEKYKKEVEIPLVNFFTEWAQANLPDPDEEKNYDNPRAKQRLKMERSATEQEIQAGALKVDDAERHVIAYFRDKITDCPSDNRIFIDADLAPIMGLKDRLKKKITEDNVIPIPAIWNVDKANLDGSHLKELSKEIEERLKNVIDSEIEKFDSVDENEMEELAHVKFAEERSHGFAGRNNDLAKLREYIDSSLRKPFVVWGQSGIGKSAFLAKAFLDLIKDNTYQNSRIICRFIGTTGKSSNGNSLLYNICNRLCKFYKGNSEEIPIEPSVMQYKFREYLSKATKENPLIIFLDALDQSYDNDPFGQMNWLPETLPEHVKIILSTLPGVSYENLIKREKEPVFHKLRMLTKEDGIKALESWLTDCKRTLRDYQFDDVIKAFLKADCNPLYLRLAFDQVKKWKYEDRLIRLGHNIQEMIENLYSTLSSDKSHGIIVDKILTALRCAKYGLSDDEILGILAADKEFWIDFRIQSFHEYHYLEQENDGKQNNVTKYIPPVLWIRLYNDLEYYLTRRTVPGGEVITFYHRQLAEAVDKIYFRDLDKERGKHKELAEYFAAKDWFRQIEPEQMPNVRKCDELPWQQTKAEMWDELTATLCNLDFIQAKSAAGMTYEMMNDYQLALDTIPIEREIKRREEERVRQARMEKYTHDLIAYAKGEIKELDILESITPWTKEQIEKEINRIKNEPDNADKIRDFYNFLGQEANNLQNYACEFPHFATQQAWNYANEGFVGNLANSKLNFVDSSILILANSIRPKWNPLAILVCSYRLDCSGLGQMKIVPNGKIVGLVSESECIILDSETGRIINNHKLYGNYVESIDITPDGKFVIIGLKEGGILLCNFDQYPELERIKKFDFSVNSIMITSDASEAMYSKGRYCFNILSLPINNENDIYQMYEEEVKVRERIELFTTTPNFDTVITTEKKRTILVLKVINFEYREYPVNRTKRHKKDIISLCVTPDGNKIISGSGNGECIYYDILKNECYKLPGHENFAFSVDISPDGKIAVSSSLDRIICWDLVNHEIIRNIEIKAVQKVKLVANATRAISLSLGNKVDVWDLEKGKSNESHYRHQKRLSNYCITSNKDYVVTCSMDKTYMVWKFPNMETTNNIEEEKIYIKDVVVANDNLTIVSCSNRIVSRHLESASIIAHFGGEKEYASSLITTPDGKRLVSYSNSSELAKLWDIKSGIKLKELDTFSLMCYGVESIMLSPSGKIAILEPMSSDYILLWNLDNGNTIITAKAEDMMGPICITPDAKYAFTTQDSGQCLIWDLISGKSIKNLFNNINYYTREHYIGRLITPNGKYVIAVTQEKFHVWEFKRNSNIRHFNNKNRETILSSSLDCKYIISASYSGSISIWKIDTGEVIATYINQKTIRFCEYTKDGIFVGFDNGEVAFLKLTNNFEYGSAVVTIRRIWDFELNKYLLFSADCPLCGHRFDPPEEVMKIIRKITKEAGLKPEQSACLELSEEVWEDPGLISECPKCGEKLKFNPFVVDNSGEGEVERLSD